MITLEENWNGGETFLTISTINVNWVGESGDFTMYAKYDNHVLH
jgi:hypothetical protein